MSAKARPTTCAAMSCCASRSPWVPSRAPSPQRLQELANRPALQQAGQEAEPGKERVPSLPGLELDIGTGMPVDLPGDIIGASGEGEAGLGKAKDRQRLPLDAAPGPAPAGPQ